MILNCRRSTYAHWSDDLNYAFNDRQQPKLACLCACLPMPTRLVDSHPLHKPARRSQTCRSPPFLYSVTLAIPSLPHLLG